MNSTTAFGIGLFLAFFIVVLMSNDWIAPKDPYKIGYTDGYQSRIDYEHGK